MPSEGTHHVAEQVFYQVEEWTVGRQEDRHDADASHVVYDLWMPVNGRTIQDPDGVKPEYWRTLPPSEHAMCWQLCTNLT